MALLPTPSTTLLAICLSPSLCTLLPSQEKPPYVDFFIALSFAFSSEVAGLQWPVTVVLHGGAELSGNFPEGCVSCFFGELYSRQWPAASWVRWKWVPCWLLLSISCFRPKKKQIVNLNSGKPAIKVWGEVVKYMNMQEGNSHLLFGYLVWRQWRPFWLTGI